MKNYLLFIGDKYYAAGGFNDFYSDYHTFDEAYAILDMKVPEDDGSQWGHIFSITEGRITYERNRAYM